MSLCFLAISLFIFYASGGLASRLTTWHGGRLDEIYSLKFYLRAGPAFLFLVLAIFTGFPRLSAFVRAIQRRLPSHFPLLASTAACIFFWAFILHFGNREFGGWDFSVLLDTGWRQLTGQQPYVDFVTPNPPGFNLGVKYAFEIFGPSWNAQLYITAIFTIVTFLWMQWLLNNILSSRSGAFLMAFAIETSSTLTLDFWWYNNVTSITATIFFLSCIFYLERPDARDSVFSYFVSLAILGTMKPNVAGLLCAGGIPLVFIGTRKRLRLAALTLAGIITAVLFLKLNHVNLAAMLAAYAGVAKERGPLSNFGFRDLRWREIARVAMWVAALSAPLPLLFQLWAAAAWRKNWRMLAYRSLLVVAVLISLYGMFGNGELKDVEWALFLAAGAILIFENAGKQTRLHRFYIALVCSLILSGIFIGASRLRVLFVGPHTYFEWADSNTRTGNAFLADMKASRHFALTLDEIRKVLSENPGPVFLGPRVDFAYAVYGIPSPAHLPLYWQPGTSFATSEEPALRRQWYKHNFKTLVFLKNDFTFYKAQHLERINLLYSRDDSYQELTVFHNRN